MREAMGAGWDDSAGASGCPLAGGVGVWCQILREDRGFGMARRLAALGRMQDNSFRRLTLPSSMRILQPMALPRPT